MKKILFLIFAACFSASAFAQTAPSQGVLDSMLSHFTANAVNQMAISQGFGKQIFAGLVVFDLSIFIIKKLPSASDLTDLIGGITLKVFSWGFFYTLIVMGPQWIPMITQSFMEIGTKIGGGTKLITPSSVVDLALQSASSIWNAYSSNDSGLSLGGDMLLGLIVVLGIVFTVIGFVLIAIQLIATQIELVMATSVGFFMLGFSGASFTTMFSEKYFGYLVSAGIKLVMIAVLAGFGTQVSQDFIAAIGQFNGKTMAPINLLMATTPPLIYGVLALQLPAMAGAIMNGAPSMSAGSLAGGAAAIAGGVAGAAMAGAGLAAGAAGAAGGVSDFAKQSLDRLSALTNVGGDAIRSGGDNFDRLASLTGANGGGHSIGNPASNFNGSNEASKPSTLKDGLNKTGDALSKMASQEGGGGSGIPIRFNHLGD